ncbi:hypothetical protein GCM10009857_06620 [Agromyces soli]
MAVPSLRELAHSREGSPNQMLMRSSLARASGPSPPCLIRSARGHLAEDTAENRALIAGANDPAYLRSSKELSDGTILEKYFRVLPDGTQSWAEVRGNEITNGGLNLEPW